MTTVYTAVFALFLTSSVLAQISLPYSIILFTTSFRSLRQLENSKKSVKRNSLLLFLKLMNLKPHSELDFAELVLQYLQ